MTAPHRMVLGLTGDALGYFIPSDEWMTGLNDDGEESISLGMTVWGHEPRRHGGDDRRGRWVRRRGGCGGPWGRPVG